MTFKLIGDLFGRWEKMFRPMEPGEYVDTVWNVRLHKFVQLTKPTTAENVRCDRCKGNVGLRADYGWWTCANPSCLDASYQVSEAKREEKKGKLPPTPMDMLGVPLAYQNANLVDMRQDASILMKLTSYTNKPKGFALFSGGAGTGKTYAACACIDSVRRKGFSSRFVNMSDLYVDWLEIKRGGGNELNLIEKYFNPELLVMDDLGTKTPTEGYLEFMYILINKRSTSDCGTIITTNLGSEGMYERLGEAITSRICSGLIIKFAGEDKRTRHHF